MECCYTIVFTVLLYMFFFEFFVCSDEHALVFSFDLSLLIFSCSSIVSVLFVLYVHKVDIFVLFCVLLFDQIYCIGLICIFLLWT